MGGADHPHVDLDLLAAAEALDHPLLQEAQQLGLQAERQVADLVEEQRAAVRHARSCPRVCLTAPVNAPRS